jgi:type II restriction/modification system DNA methylase subunit YeeA
MVTLVQRMLDLHLRQLQAAGSEAARERLQREINVTDEQIDALVYELYGLTDEEIKIVEGR